MKREEEMNRWITYRIELMLVNERLLGNPSVFIDLNLSDPHATNWPSQIPIPRFLSLHGNRHALGGGKDTHPDGEWRCTILSVHQSTRNSIWKGIHLWPELKLWTSGRTLVWMKPISIVTKSCAHPLMSNVDIWMRILQAYSLLKESSSSF